MEAGSTEEAFQTLVETRLDESYRVARLILRHDQDAQDAAHDAFVSAWRNRASLRDADRFDAWFRRILVNACRDRLRRRSRRPSTPLPDELALAGPDPFRVTEDREAIARAFDDLNPDQRIAVVLRFYSDLPVDEIAKVLRARPGTVKSRLHHAMRTMRRALGSDGPEATR